MKIALWVTTILLLALLIIQNQAFFFEKTGFGLDFYYKKYQTPKVHNITLFLIFFFTGLFIAYIYYFLGQLKTKKTIKNLNVTIQSQMEVISGLKSDMAAKDTQIEQLTSQKPGPESGPKQEQEQTSAAPVEKATLVDVDPTYEDKEQKVS
jgi:hypothetical protein